MLEKFNQLAEQAATNVSRRSFLGRLGRGAMAAAAAAGGLLAFGAGAQAGRAGRGARACWINSANTQCQGVPYGSPCVIDDAPGTCVSDGNIRIAPGVYDCNYCKPKKPAKEGR